ncbi:hypothetical protein ACFL21_02910 [Patescibacteria group bacterium]
MDNQETLKEQPEDKPETGLSNVDFNGELAAYATEFYRFDKLRGFVDKNILKPRKIRSLLKQLESMLKGQIRIDDEFARSIIEELELGEEGAEKLPNRKLNAIAEVFVFFALVLYLYTHFDTGIPLDSFENAKEIFEQLIISKPFLLVTIASVLNGLFVAGPAIAKNEVRGRIRGIVELDEEDIGSEKIEQFVSQNPEVFIRFVNEKLPELVEKFKKDRLEAAERLEKRMVELEVDIAGEGKEIDLSKRFELNRKILNMEALRMKYFEQVEKMQKQYEDILRQAEVLAAERNIENGEKQLNTLEVNFGSFLDASSSKKHRDQFTDPSSDADVEDNLERITRIVQGSRTEAVEENEGVDQESDVDVEVDVDEEEEVGA